MPTIVHRYAHSTTAAAKPVAVGPDHPATTPPGAALPEDSVVQPEPTWERSPGPCPEQPLPQCAASPRPGTPRQEQPPTAAAARRGGPILRLFNQSLHIGYEAEVVLPMDGGQRCVVLALWRGQFDRTGLDKLLAETLRERRSFAPPASVVTWGDVIELVEWSGCCGVETRADLLAWDPRILRCDPCATAIADWTFATPSLTTACERSFFERTDVELLFRYYETPLLFVSLAHAPVPPSAPAEVTPPNRVQTRSLAPTPATPQKGPQQCKGREASAGEEGDGSPPLPGPRCLADSFRRHAQEEADWTAAALGRQLVEWHERQQWLRARLEGKPAPAAYEVVRAEMQTWARRPPAEWNGLWMLSLQEYACDMMLDAAGYAAVRVRAGAGGARPPSPLPTTRESLVRCRRGAVRTLTVLTKIDVAARRKEKGLPRCRFPFALQRVLLLTMEVRVLRHLSLVEAAMGAVPTQQRLAVLAGQMAQRYVGALAVLGPLGSPWAPLAPSLLLSGLSLLELARYLELGASARCQLVESAVRVFAVWRSITLDPRWAPCCVEELLDSITASDGGITDAAVLRRTAALRQHIEQPVPPPTIPEADERTSSAEDAAVVAACLGLTGTDCPAYVGYCLRQIWGMAALDQLYQHGVRQLTRLQNAV